MRKRKRRAFTAELKQEVVRLCEVGDRSIAQVAKDLDLTETALRDWVRRAEVDAGKGPVGALTTAEREELTRLRRENKRLQMEREIPKKAAAFFAKEGADRGSVEPDDQVPFPVTRHCSVGDFRRPLGDHDFWSDERFTPAPRACLRYTQRSPGAQAGDEFSLESTTALDAQRRSDRRP